MNEIKEMPIEYQIMFGKSIIDLSAHMVEGIQEHLHEDLNNWDQLGVCLISISNLITDIVESASEGTEEPFTFEHFIEHLLKMNEIKEKGK